VRAKPQRSSSVHTEQSGPSNHHNRSNSYTYAAREHSFAATVPDFNALAFDYDHSINSLSNNFHLSAGDGFQPGTIDPSPQWPLNVTGQHSLNFDNALLLYNVPHPQSGSDWTATLMTEPSISVENAHDTLGSLDTNYANFNNNFFEDPTPSIPHNPSHHFQSTPPPSQPIFLPLHPTSNHQIPSPTVNTPATPTSTNTEAPLLQKRQRNNIAARKYRQKRVDRISELEDALQAMTHERDKLRVELARREAEVDVLRSVAVNRKDGGSE